jgi:hypothetical protein
MMHFCQTIKKNVVCDDTIFIAFDIKMVIGDNIWWFTSKEWTTLDMHILKFQGYVKLIDDIFLKIHKL